MKLTKTREEVLLIGLRMEQVQGLNGYKLCYAVERTVEHIASEMKSIRKSEELLKPYHDAQNDLAKEYSARDKDDNPVASVGGYKMGNDPTGYSKAMKQVDVDFKELLDERKAFLEEEVEITVHAIEETLIPEDIEHEQLRAIWVLMKREE